MNRNEAAELHGDDALALPDDGQGHGGGEHMNIVLGIVDGEHRGSQRGGRERLGTEIESATLAATVGDPLAQGDAETFFSEAIETLGDIEGVVALGLRTEHHVGSALGRIVGRGDERITAVGAHSRGRR